MYLFNPEREFGDISQIIEPIIFLSKGTVVTLKKQFTVAISEKQQLKGLYRIDDMLEGTAWTIKYEEREFADYYRAGALKLLDRVNENLR